MALHVYNDLVQGSDEWLEARRGIVTASVVGQLITTRTLAAIDYECADCGAPSGSPCISKVRRGGTQGNPIKSVHPVRSMTADELRPNSPQIVEPARDDKSRALTTLLVAERITGWVDPVYVTDDMMRGTLDEPIARAIYAEHYAPVTETGFMVREEDGWRLGYSPDGLVQADGLIEIKSRRPKKHLQTILADEVPVENLAQIQAGLLVTGRAWCDYVSYCGGMPLWTKRIYPDERWADALIEAVTAFERTAALITDTAYNRAVAGRPATERIEHFMEASI